MCNIAGYIGSDRAAPILLDMIERQEGWGGGYYTGIATIHDGRLHTCKVVGDTAVLRANTEAEDLPGAIGIIHSRSKSGGDREWGHPFLSTDGTMAYIANGSQGAFADPVRTDAVWQELCRAGCTFASRVDGPVGTYPCLSDGGCVHISDLMCGLVDQEAKKAGSLLEGMARAFSRSPSEVVGLSLALSDPEAICLARVNQPMMLGRDGNTVYLGTTAMAFPENATKWLTPIPANCAVRVTRDDALMRPLDPLPAPVTSLLPWHESEHAMRDVLADGAAHPFGHFSKVVTPFFANDGVHPRNMMIYEILRRLQQQGVISVECQRVDGVTPELTAPQLRARATNATATA